MPPETMNFIAACAEMSTTRTRSRGTMKSSPEKL